MRWFSRTGNRKNSGFTLIELLISMGFLAVGLLGTALLITAAVASNTRNKVDTGGTLIAQRVMELVSAQSVGAAPPQITDCNPAGPTAFTIQHALAGGALLDATTGNIDFKNQTNAAVTANYKMLYVGCGAAGQQVTYDVRWNIQALANGARMVTVSARQIGATGSLRWATQPVTLKSIALN